MSTRQFFIWSGWAIVLALGLPVLLGSMVGPTAPALVVVAKDDFPANYSISREPMIWRIYPGIPETSHADYWRIIVNPDGPYEKQQAGHITTARYFNAEALDQAYEAIRVEAEINGNAQPIDFGARGSQSTLGYFNSSDVLFQRCGMVVHVTLEDGVVAQLVDYARRLDQRIVERICRK